MRFSIATLALLASTVVGQSTVAGSTKVTGERGDATTVSNQPAGPTYTAVLPSNPLGVKGSISATQGKDGNGVHFNVEFSNLPKEGGPFPYHIHVLPVAEGGNCSSTLAHLDPFIRGEKPPCDPSAPETCQTGDLSGKYGKVEGSDPFTDSYDDPFTSLVEGPGSFFGNRSFVFHFANATRISCASFQLYNPTNGTTGGNSTGNGTVTPTASGGDYTAPPATGAPITGGAAQLIASGAGLLGAFAAAAMLL